MAVNYSELKKGGFMQQKQKDNFSLRVKVVGGNLTAQQLCKVAETAEKYGDGYVHLTSRQSVEIPFIKLENIDDVRKALEEGGMQPAVCGAGVRTITACQGGAVCSSGCIDTYELAKEFDERYSEEQLPHKFKIGITGCRNNCLKSEENDLGIKGAMKTKLKEDLCVSCGACTKVCRDGAISMNNGKLQVDSSKCTLCGRCAKICPKKAWDTKQGYVVSFGGLFGNSINKGETIIPFIDDHDKLMAVCDAAVEFFRENAKPKERFKFTIDRVGKDKFKEKILEAYNNAG